MTRQNNLLKPRTRFSMFCEIYGEDRKKKKQNRNVYVLRFHLQTISYKWDDVKNSKMRKGDNHSIMCIYME